MTQKKEKILTAALELFANEGYTSTSTSKIAKRASVSEGLIFRHFTSKTELLIATVEAGKKQFIKLHSHILLEEETKAIIRDIILIAKEITENDEYSNFWKLHNNTKWNSINSNSPLFEQLTPKLEIAFTELRYKNPQKETQLLLIQLDGILSNHFLVKEFSLDEMLDFLLNKYGL